ncbi:hypothetical protein QTP88_018232 [Uroleucon formosanum]
MLKESQEQGTEDNPPSQDTEGNIVLLMLNDAFQVLLSSNEIANDPYYSYGQHLSNELRKYDPKTLSYVKREFADILFEADQVARGGNIGLTVGTFAMAASQILTARPLSRW